MATSIQSRLVLARAVPPLFGARSLHTHAPRATRTTRTMQAPPVLRLLRPLLARPAQFRAGGMRFKSRDCDKDKTCEKCKPCKPVPQPECRGRPADVIIGKRVVCCPPPQGLRPPCAGALPRCPHSCENMPKREISYSEPTEGPCGAMDRVSKKMREQEEELRRQYEEDVEKRKKADPAKYPEVNCKMSSPESQSQVIATDGRSYTVLPGEPPPPKCPEPRCPTEPERKPPEPQLVQLKRPACAAAGPNPCAHQPRTLVSIDRTAWPDLKCPESTCADEKSRSKSPEPRPLPKKLCGNKGKGLKARIMETLNRGRCASPACGGASGRYSISNKKKEKDPGQISKAGDKSWCDNLPAPKPAPDCCTEPTLREQLKRTPQPECKPLNRGLHTSVTSEAAKPAADREATIAAAMKLKATLEEREKLNEAGRGRTVLPPVCEEALPPPPKPSGGALELGVPPGADTVCVRVSVGSGGGAAPASPCARAGPSAPCGAPPPPAAPRAGGPAADSWLSIKSLQQKLSGRQPCATKPAESLCGPSSAPSKPKSLTQPTSANPCAKQKMADIIPKTIFIKTS